MPIQITFVALVGPFTSFAQNTLPMPKSNRCSSPKGIKCNIIIT